MGTYGMTMMADRARKRRDGRGPKGFDIILADIVGNYNLSEDEIKQLGELTANNKIAHAIVGHEVWYRRATIERLFNREQAEVQQ